MKPQRPGLPVERRQHYDVTIACLSRRRSRRTFQTVPLGAGGRTFDPKSPPFATVRRTECIEEVEETCTERSWQDMRCVHANQGYDKAC